jgi:deoxyxylulose-5-phosphate synthase
MSLNMQRRCDRVRTPQELRALTTDLPQLAADFARDHRRGLGDRRHLGAGLGVVELPSRCTVRHAARQAHLGGPQTYPHKILTGRRPIRSLRQGGPVRLQARGERIRRFGAGHSSTSIWQASAWRWRATRRQNVVCVIGDGA